MSITAPVVSSPIASSSSVPLISIPPMSPPQQTLLGLSANQIDLIVKNIGELMGGAAGGSLLATLPQAILTTYQSVSQFSTASQVQQQQMVLTLLTQGIEKLQLPAVDQALIMPVLETLVPSLIQVLPAVEAGLYKLVQEVEEEVQTCWGKCCTIC